MFEIVVAGIIGFFVYNQTLDEPYFQFGKNNQQQEQTLPPQNFDLRAMFDDQKTGEENTNSNENSIQEVTTKNVKGTVFPSQKSSQRKPVVSSAESHQPTTTPFYRYTETEKTQTEVADTTYDDTQRDEPFLVPAFERWRENYRESFDNRLETHQAIRNRF